MRRFLRQRIEALEQKIVRASRPRCIRYGLAGSPTAGLARGAARRGDPPGADPIARCGMVGRGGTDRPGAGRNRFRDLIAGAFQNPSNWLVLGPLLRSVAHDMFSYRRLS